MVNQSTMALWEVEFDYVLEESKQVIKQCLQKFNLDEIFLSFNGGKDCTVLLHLTLQIINDMYGRSRTKDLRIIYIRTYNPFPELENFIRQTEKNYGLNLSIYDGGMKETLQTILDQDSRLKACLMGTRKTDPYSSHLKHMTKTDKDWPQLLRVLPLLNWSYHQIWSYLLKYKVPYCTLYDKGYTSIGSTLNTIRNPYLQYKGTGNIVMYNAAYYLKDETHERNGRIANNNLMDAHHGPHNGHSSSNHSV